MGLFMFGRFRAREGQQAALEAAMLESVAPTRSEPGCLGIDIFRSVDDPQLLWVHSQWTDEESFEAHIKSPQTMRLIDRIQAMTTHQVDVARTYKIT